VPLGFLPLPGYAPVTSPGKAPFNSFDKPKKGAHYF